LGGQDDWRLPTLKELDSILDLSVYDPVIDSRYFNDTQSENYWSSTTSDGSWTSAWVMNFNSGDDGTLAKTETAYVRAVLGGKAGLPGVLHHFDISVGSSAKALGVAFYVTVTARDRYEKGVSTATGPFTFTCTAGDNSVSASNLILANGHWSGQGIEIVATQGAISGVSDPFTVSGGAQNTGGIEGAILDNYNTKVTGKVEVWLLSGPGGTLKDTFEDSVYCFQNVPSGYYFLYAKHLTSGALAQLDGFFVRGGQPAQRDIQFFFAHHPTKSLYSCCLGSWGRPA